MMGRELTALQKEKLIACILGCAVGDAVGLPFEGMRPRSIAKVLKKKQVRHCLIGKYGMWSDDTDHSIMLVESILYTQTTEEFVKSFSKKLRLWFLTFPPGIGLGTARSILKLLLGFKRSGVYSAGNGPCMRAASLGVIFRNDHENLVKYNKIHTKLTHTDPKAQIASRAIVEIAAYLVDSSLNLASLESLVIKETDAEWQVIVNHMMEMLEENKPPEEFAQICLMAHGKGISGYAYHTVPAVVYTCMYYKFKFKKTITKLIKLGGDTDTCCAIAGSLCGIAHGVEGMPDMWKCHIREFPIRFIQLNSIVDRPLFKKRDLPLRFIRNIYQLLIVLVHGFRRLLPTIINKHFY